MNRRRVKHKFGAIPTTIDDIRFASKLEASYYQRLKMEVNAGTVLFFLRQVPIHLPANIRYVVDFVEFRADGEVVFTDVKGMETDEFKIKKKLVERLYPVTINVVKKGYI